MKWKCVWSGMENLLIISVMTTLVTSCFGPQARLGLATTRGSVKSVEAAIADGADVDKPWDPYEIPLVDAVKRGHNEVVEVLLSHGADVNQKDEIWNGSSPLCVAAIKGNTEIAKLLIESGADVTAADDFGQTPLHIASYEGNPELIELLVRNGADVNAKRKTIIPEILPTTKGQHLEKIAKGMASRRLIDGTEGVIYYQKWGNRIPKSFVAFYFDPRLADGETPLHDAAYNGKADSVRILLSKGAEVNARTDFFSVTPLHHAATQRHYETVRVLIENGANVNAKAKFSTGYIYNKKNFVMSTNAPTIKAITPLDFILAYGINRDLKKETIDLLKINGAIASGVVDTRVEQ